MLPQRPARVAVASASGSGKTTLAAEVGVLLGIPHVEIDALFHHAGWTPNPGFEAAVRSFTAEDAWVTEWQYDLGRPLVAARAQLLVLLDPPRLVVLVRVVRRTVLRSLRGVELWNGNREAPLRTFFTDRDHIVRWSWRTAPLVAPRVRAALAEHTDLAFVRIRTARDRRKLLALLVASCR